MNSELENNFNQTNQTKDLEEGLENIILVEDDENVNKNLKKISSLTKNNTKNDEPQIQKKIEKIKTNLILYIGNLPASIDNYELYELIQKNAIKDQEFGIDSMNIKKTQKDSAYAYVKFKTKKEVEAVRENLHLMTFKEKIIKADLFKKEEKRLINDINSNVFFKGFSKDMDIQEVLKIFREIGDVNSIKPKISTKGIFLGSGYVSFKDPESAADAILKLNNKDINNTRISVIKYNKYETRVLNRSFPVVLVQNLPPHIQTNADLKNLMIKFCETTLCGVYTVNKSQEMASKFNFQNMNFNSENEMVTNGIVLLPSTEEVEKCLINCNDPELNEFDLEISQAVCDKVNCERLIQAKKNALKSKYEGCNIIVKNLPKNMDKKEVTSLFNTFGPVKSVKIATEGVFKEIKDNRGIVMDKQYVYESKGFGYVLFMNVESAKKCMSELHDVPYAFGTESLLLKMEYFNYDRIPGAEKEKKTDKKNDYQKNNNYKGNKGGQKFNNKKEHFNKFPQQNNFNNQNMGNQNMPNNFGNNMGNPGNNQGLQGMGNMTGGNPRDMRMNPGNMDHNPYQNQNPQFMNNMNNQNQNMMMNNQNNFNNNNNMQQNNFNHRNNNMQNNNQFQDQNERKFDPRGQQNNNNDNQAIMIGLNYELKYISALITQIQKSDINDKDDKMGETIYNFIIKCIEALNLNNLGKQEITNEIMSQKLTGILLQSELLIEIMSDIDSLINTIQDLINRVYNSISGNNNNNTGTNVNA